MVGNTHGAVVANEVIGDYEYLICKDERGQVRAFYRLCDSRQENLRRLPARSLPESLKAVFTRATGCTREQLEI